MQKRNVLNSPRLTELKKRRKKVIFNRFLILGIALIAAVAAGIYFSRLSSLNISAVEVVGNKVVDTDLVESLVREEMSGKYLWLFPKTNVLIYPRDAIRNALWNKFNRLDDIEFSVKRKTLTVTVSERSAKYMWCGDVPPEGGSTNKEKCYFMDDEGYIFDEAPYFSGEVYFKFYGRGGIDTANPVGSRYSEQNFGQLVSFKDILVDMGIRPVMARILEDGDIELFLARGKSGLPGPKLLFRSDADLENVAENLQAALLTEPLLSGFKNNYSSLLYIDLRFGNKVYFKFSPAA